MAKVKILKYFFDDFLQVIKFPFLKYLNIKIKNRKKLQFQFFFKINIYFWKLISDNA